MVSLCETKSPTKHINTQELSNESKIDTYEQIDTLQSFGIQSGDITKLKSGGKHTILSLIQTTKKDLCMIKGLSEAKVDKIIEAAIKIQNSNSFLTGRDILSKRSMVIKLHSGSSQLDLLLGGGFESQSITELFGENRTGKTQICHTLCVTAQLPRDSHGGNGKVCYLDTEGTFRPEKIIKIAERFNVNGEEALDNILYARVYTHEHLISLLTMAAAKMTEDSYSLMIIDSIIACFRVDFSGRGELAERQQKLNKTLSMIMKLSEQFNLVALMTNQVMSDPGGGLTLNPNAVKPVGGHILGHAATTRIALRKGKGDQRVAKVYDSPNLAESETIFQLGDCGVMDPLDA